MAEIRHIWLTPRQFANTYCEGDYRWALKVVNADRAAKGKLLGGVSKGKQWLVNSLVAEKKLHSGELAKIMSV